MTVLLDCQRITSVGELKRAVGTVVFEQEANDWPDDITDDDCLCWVNFLETATQSGYHAVIEHGGDPSVWKFVKRK